MSINISQKVTYLNGVFTNHSDLKINIDDRGFLFGDGLYEVIAFTSNGYIDFEAHYDRFVRSCNELGYMMKNTIPNNINNFKKICHNLLLENQKNGLFLNGGYFYIQVTRGYLGVRNHNAPIVDNELTFMIVINDPVKIQDWWITKGLSCLILSDNRWQRRDIKSIQLLPNILAKQEAVNQEYDDAIFVDCGIITEATSANIFIVKDGILKTHAKTNKILWGITRMRVLEIAKSLNIKTQETFFTEQEIYEADEIFLTNSNSHIRPVTKINKKMISNGNVGEISKKLYFEYQKFISK